MDCRICCATEGPKLDWERYAHERGPVAHPVNRGAATALGGIACVVSAGACFAILDTVTQYGHFVLALAYQRAPASSLMPYLYCQLGFAVLAGWVAFSHVPDGWACTGIALIALSGICGICGAWLTAREHRLPTALPES